MKRHNVSKTGNSSWWFRSGLLKYSCLLWLILLVAACYEPETGCLDIEATNFNASADDPCPDCCTYPNLRFEIKHVFGDTVLPFGTHFTLDSIDYFILRSWQFYLSELKLIVAGDTIGVLDTISLVLDQNGLITKELVEDNYAIGSRSIFSINMGTIKYSGFIEDIRFQVGLDAQSNQTAADSMPSGHPLAIQADSMFFDEDRGYIFNKIQFQRDTTTGSSTTTLEIGTDANLVLLNFPFNQSIIQGDNITVNLQLDYKLWLKGINFVTDSDEIIMAKIVANTPEAFSLIE